MPELPCAVPRFTPRACKNPAVFVVHRPRGVPLGQPQAQPNPTHVEEPSCATCAEPYRREGSGAEIRDLEPGDHLRVCNNPHCESGALAGPQGLLCPTCHDRAGHQPYGEKRYADLEGNPALPEVDLNIREGDIKAKPRALKATVSMYYECGKVVQMDGSTVDLNGCRETHEGSHIHPPEGWVERKVPVGPDDDLPAHAVRFCPKHRNRIPRSVQHHIPPPYDGMWWMERADGDGGFIRAAVLVVFDDGTAVTKWRDTRSTTTWEDVEDAVYIHILNHPDTTRLVSWDEEDRWPPRPCPDCHGVGRHEDTCVQVVRFRKSLEAVKPMTERTGRIEYFKPTTDQLVATAVRELEGMVERMQAVANPIARSLLAVLEPWLKEVRILSPDVDRGGTAHCRACNHHWPFPPDPTGRGPQACPACNSPRVSLKWDDGEPS